MRRLRSMKRRHVLVAGVVGLVVAGAIVAMSTGTGGQRVTLGATEPSQGTAARDSAGSFAAPIAGAAGVAPESQKQIGAPAPPVPSTVPGPVVPGSLKIVRSGELRVKVGKDGFAAAFDRVAGIAAAHGGFVASSSTSSVEKARAGELTVRIPADKFDAARRDLAALGKVEAQALRGEDVSAQLVDYDARLKSLAAQEDALRGLLGKATAVGEVLQVQSSLFEVRQQIEQLQAQRANLDQAASLATLQVSLYEPGATFEPRPAEPATGLAGSLARAVDAAEAVVGGMIVVVGALAPLVLIGLVGWGVSRLFRRRRSGGTPGEAPAGG